ncbi:MAG: L-2-hydroxyglutarate oxidase LhgO [Verrucomicrobia bacterium ADurb.Bin345]|nr:MAG: L-2-hydroxyglutarate oxidase LhgO [Verrucomicrobia bacterium ADurb.Bin345]
MGETFDIAVIGGGIVGTATAMALLSRPGRSVAVLEAEGRLAAHQTGHNSGVIHSGLYYKPGSLKAANCTAGREALYRFCSEHGIRHERCGKIVVATSADELPDLARLEERGRANGLEGIDRLTGDEIREYEPHVTGIAGLRVPQTGIVDYEEVTEAFGRIVRERGGEIRLDCRVLGVRRDTGGLVVQTGTGEVRARHLINCAGLQSDRVARLCGVEPGVRIVPFRGEYYELAGEKEHLVRNLVYPVPDPAFPFLGVHFTRMIGGGVEAGPNAVLAFKREGYAKTSFSFRDSYDTFTYPGALRLFSKHLKMGVGEFYRSFSKRAFLAALRRLLPELELGDLQPGGAGVRAQAVGPDGGLIDDFRIVEADRMIHVLNAPSPAATASISIGQRIAELAETNFGLA